jgi:hypothetical protein
MQLTWPSAAMRGPMGKWIPEFGTMYRTLLDRCLQIFDIRHKPAEDAFVCSGDPAGHKCQCVWNSGDFLIIIGTPQGYGRNVLAAHRSNAGDWQYRGRFWRQTTGFLHIGRVVPRSSSHFEWINPSAIASGFGISAPPAHVELAATVLNGLVTDDGWFSAQLRHDGAWEFAQSSISDPRAVRLVRLFRNAKAHLTVWEVVSCLGLSIFEYQTGYSDGDINIAVSKMSEAERFENAHLRVRIGWSEQLRFLGCLVEQRTHRASL